MKTRNHEIMNSRNQINRELRDSVYGRLFDIPEFSHLEEDKLEGDYLNLEDIDPEEDLEECEPADPVQFFKYPQLEEPEDQSAWYRLERVCTEYGLSFLEELRTSDRWKKHEGAVLPIVFMDEREDTSVLGRLAYGRRASCIIIFLPHRREEMYLSERLKQVIRHEIIHFYLWEYHVRTEDDSHPLFWAFCKIFDAGAYRTIEIPAYQRAYNHFLEQYDPDKPKSENIALAYKLCGKYQ